jgi:serine phosphatase RsbU (regulator of sigma subunit)
MKKLLRIFKMILIVQLILSTVVLAQEGNPFQTNFVPEDESLNENYSICQDKEGVMIIANRKGIVTFDAYDWKIIKTPELPLVLAKNPKNDIVYTGCRNSIGYLSKNNLGDYEYNEISKENVGVVLQIAFSDNYVFFLSQTALTRYNSSNPKDITFWKCKTNQPFTFMFEFNGKMYIDQAELGLQMVSKSELTLSNKSFPLSKRMVFTVEYDKQNVLLGTSDNKLYLFNGIKIIPFQIQDQQYITDGGLIDGKIIDDQQIALATLESGCLIIDKKSGKTLYTINYQTGLPDDEILAMGVDKNHGIWLAHNFGLTRVDVGIPMRNFSTYKGLNGILLGTAVYNNKLYVATSSGVYYLDKKKDYTEYTLKENLSTSASISFKNPIDFEKSNKTELVENKGFFSKLFTRKQKAAAEQPNAINSVNDDKNKVIGGSEVIQDQKTIKKSYRIISVSHLYNKIPGFDSRTKQMLEFNGHLIVSTQTGLFDLSNDISKEIFKSNTIYNIYAIKAENAIYVCSEQGINKVVLTGSNWSNEPFPVKITEPVYSVAKDVFENYWLGCENSVIRLKLKRNGDIKENKVYKFKSEYREKVIVRLSDKKPVFFLSNGIYSIFKDSIQPNIWLSKFTGSKSRFYLSQQDYSFLYNNKQWICLSAYSEPDTIAPNYLNIFDNVNQVYTDAQNNIWVINDNIHLCKIDSKQILAYQSNFSAFIKRFYGLSGEAFPLYGVTLDKQQKSLKMQISAPFFIKANSNQYQFKFKGEDWNEWSTNPIKDLYFDRTGNFEVIIRARNIFGSISNEEVLKFTVNPPFYNRWWFYLIYVFAGLSIIYIVIKFRERKLIEANEILEEKVKERTKQIEKQKEEIEAQSRKISIQNKEITDSIHYAKRIQTAVMPDSKAIESLLQEHFVLFRPKDIVSGDFFWLKKINNKVIIAAADCTGHGVPGGFLSMLGISFLNEISAINKDIKASDILDILKLKIKSTLTPEGHDEFETKDGMDIALCIIDFNSKKLQFAGANNPLYIIRDNIIIDYSADKMPIGAYMGEKELFTNNEIDLQTNDCIIMFSDGYRDQFGGADSKRMKTSGFRKILLDINKHPMKKQKELLEQYYDNWKGENEQLDDIMVFGIKI